jgi:hypothetical protein
VHKYLGPFYKDFLRAKLELFNSKLLAKMQARPYQTAVAALKLMKLPLNHDSLPSFSTKPLFVTVTPALR